MSYDVSLSINTGHEEHEVFSTNYTYNCSPMFKNALTHAFGDGQAHYLSDLNNLSGGQAAAILDRAWEHMALNEDDYIPLNPENGWGDYHSALDWIKEIADNCNMHSKCILKVT